MSKSMIRLFIADDHNLFREGIINLLATEKEIFIVGEVDNGEDLVTKYSELKPDIVLADISMPRLTGIEALRKLKEQGESPKFLFLSMYCEEENIYSCSS